MTTFMQVKKIVVEQLGAEPDEVQMSSTFVDNLGADSLDIVELIMAFEEEFNIEIPDEKVEKMHAVGDVVRYIDGDGDGTEKLQISRERMNEIMKKKGLKFKKAGD